MKRISLASLAISAALAAALLYGPAYAADMYLRIPGITGGPHKGAPSGALPVESYQWGTSQGPVSSGRRMPQTLRVVKRIDTASPQIMKAYKSGRHFQTVTLTGGGQTFDLGDVRIRSDQPSPKGKTEAITFEFMKLSGSSIEMMMPPSNTMRHTSAPKHR